MSKDSPHTDACGELDELVSALGVARAHSRRRRVKAAVRDLQERLFRVASEAACTPANASRLKGRIGSADVRKLDALCARLESGAKLPVCFVVPGDDAAAAHLDLARAVARRCERRIVALSRGRRLKNPHVLAWLNRLSDALWLLARYEEGARKKRSGRARS